jgi:signal transduction histidine kinase
VLRIARAPLFGLALACLALGAPAAAPEGVHFREADFVFARDAMHPPTNLPWARVTLPDRWKMNWMGITGTVWYRVRFQVDKQEGEPWMVYLPRLREGGALFVNGQLLATVRGPEPGTHVRWIRPHAFLIAPAQLQAGTNELHVRIDVASESKTMSTIYVGPETVVRPLYESRHFWTYTVAQITVFITLAVAAFVLTIWIRRGMAFDYGLFGLASLFWGLHTANYVIESLPEAILLPWRVMRYASTGGFVIVMTLFMLRFAGLRRRWLERLLLAYWPTGPLVVLVGGMGWDRAVNRYYQAGLIVIAALMLGVTLAAGWRLRTPGSLALCAGVLVGIAFGVHDYLLAQGWSDPERPFLLYYSADALLMVVGILLADRFTRSLGEVEEANATLADKVSQKERELTANYEQLRGYEHERTVADERQRIMQDMHDGLGSQLLTSLAAAERGALDPKGVAQVLREAIDDMRLAIDTLSPGRDGLLEALGNLRYRLEPRFRAGGVELRFTYRDLPDGFDVPQDAALQILRVLQESLTNVLKHARARKVNVEVAMQREPRRFMLVIADDGSGFDASGPAGGRGLSGMRRRAANIGAALEVASDSRGTRVTLTYPLPDAPQAA